MDVINSILAISAVIISSITLIVVIKQTIYTRETLKTTSESFKKDRIIYQLKNLPKASLVIEVQIHLDKWEQELNDVLDLMKNNKENKGDTIKLVLKHAPKSPRLINKYLYKLMPDWLAELWILGASYYYNAAALIDDLWDEKKLEPKFNNFDDFIERFEESIENIKILKKYLKDIVPKVYLNAPASISDDKYLIDS